MLSKKELGQLEALAREVDTFPDTLQPFVSLGGQLVIHTFSMTIDQINRVAALYDALTPATMLALIEMARAKETSHVPT